MIYCPECNKELQESETTVKDVVESYPVKGTPTTITANVRFCNYCGTDIFDEELDSDNLIRAFAKYKETHGIQNL